MAIPKEEFEGIILSELQQSGDFIPVSQLVWIEDLVTFETQFEQMRKTLDELRQGVRTNLAPLESYESTNSNKKAQSDISLALGQIAKTLDQFTDLPGIKSLNVQIEKIFKVINSPKLPKPEAEQLAKEVEENCQKVMNEDVNTFKEKIARLKALESSTKSRRIFKKLRNYPLSSNDERKPIV